MRRAACLAIVGVVAMAMAPIAAGTAATPEGCAWQRHAKRVVKRVERHGRVQRVQRVKHWWTCDDRTPVSAPPATTPMLSVPPPIATLPPEEPQPEGPASHLSVKAVEWSYTLSRPEVTSGNVIVELNNQGEDNHNLKLEREGSGEPALAVPETAPGQQKTAGFTLPVGTYRLYCSLYQHDEKGMHATLTVGDG